MEDGITFVEPAGLRVDKVDHGTAGRRRGTIGDFLLIEVVGGASAFGIKQGILRGDLNSGADGNDAELDGIFGGECGMDFDEAVVGGEAFLLNFETIETEREIADDGEAGVVSGERAVKLGGVAGEIDGSFDGLGVRVGDFET